MNDKRTVEIVRLEGWRMGFYDGHYGLWGQYKKGNSVFGQGFGTNDDFVKGVLKAVGVNYVHELNGKKCLITVSGHAMPRVHKIAPLMDDEGTPFNVDAWVDKCEKDATNG